MAQKVHKIDFLHAFGLRYFAVFLHNVRTTMCSVHGRYTIESSQLTKSQSYIVYICWKIILMIIRWRFKNFSVKILSLSKTFISQWYHSIYNVRIIYIRTSKIFSNFFTKKLGTSWVISNHIIDWYQLIAPNNYLINKLS